MNLYIRYFNDETIVHNAEEAVSFLKGLDIQGFDLGEEFVRGLEAYMRSSLTYPKRYKVRTHVYFIVIRTNLETLEAFKENASKHNVENGEEKVENKKGKQVMLEQKLQGWYDAVLNFKRVIAVSGTNKFQYQDTRFRVLCYADSPHACYVRMVKHLRGRDDVDARSQYPSIKGRSFEYSYLGQELPTSYNK